MQAEKQQQQRPWKFSIHAKAKKFRFKLKATSILPTWELHQCSIVLKLGKYLLRLNSEYGTPITPKKQQPKSLKSKFRRFLQKVSFRRSKNRAIGFKQTSDLSHPKENTTKWFAYKELIFMGHLVVGILAFIYQYPDRKGVIIPCSVIWLYFALWFKNYMTGRIIRKFLVLVVSATAVCSLVFELDNYLRYDYIQMAWNHVVSSRLPGEFPRLFQTS
ncbi:hypothetical protein I3843_09G217100 [Carya illinoinensis]|uniref:Uncharacterized protein n=1 Tax=Carya illinoinensis TaxID=32201 RepID=A0A922JAQ9_CARIL|nr:hypothetical protein I3760_09G222000 [Carya illinoinensis]KAG6697899.1 hypothetical protein I3842_09G224800 [Carya illinoinensis]KAG7965311.1 hypothetical protein I3843_09G217100 [Carya illinoinensis]